MRERNDEMVNMGLGLGSGNLDPRRRASLYKVKPEQTAAISAFIKFANSSQGAAKVSPSPPSPRV